MYTHMGIRDFQCGVIYNQVVKFLAWEDNGFKYLEQCLLQTMSVDYDDSIIADFFKL